MIKSKFARAAGLTMALMANMVTAPSSMAADEVAIFDVNPASNQNDPNFHEFYAFLYIVGTIDEVKHHVIQTRWASKGLNVPKDAFKNFAWPKAYFENFTNTILSGEVPRQYKVHFIDEAIESVQANYSEKWPYYMVMCQEGPSPYFLRNLAEALEDNFGSNPYGAKNLKKVATFLLRPQPDLFLVAHELGRPARKMGMNPALAACNQSPAQQDLKISTLKPQ